jgi:hypothetical protein
MEHDKWDSGQVSHSYISITQLHKNYEYVTSSQSGISALTENLNLTQVMSTMTGCGKW